MIKIENLCHYYQSGASYVKKALDNINAEIPDHDFLAIIGHTGSGKSTLIQHLNALLKPTSGRIIINGTDITASGINLQNIRKKVGLVFQYPENQLFEETVYKDIAFGPKNIGLSDNEIKLRVEEAMALMRIDDSLVLKSPFELSGGQKRKVAIAGVLSMHPEILILDEPTAGLDPKGRDDLLDVLSYLHKNSDMTIILVSHSMEDVARVAEHILVLNKGTVYMHGTVSEVFSHSDSLSSVGLDIPEITLLINKLIEMGADLPKDVYTVKHASKILSEIMKNNFR